MCIVNEPAQIAQTQIFVSPNFDKTRQLTCYTNHVMTQSTNNVMILPVRNSKSVKFHNLEKYPEIFNDLEKNFKERSRGFGMELSYNSSNSLDVFDVGSYKVSLAHSLDDLDRLNPRHFATVNKNIKKLLTTYYQTTSQINWGFVVCKLDPGKMKEYHPIAYSNTLNSGEDLFVPTRHHHNDQIGYHEEKVSHWDHDIYSFNTAKKAGNCRVNSPGNHLKVDQIDFDFPEFKSINKF